MDLAVRDLGRQPRKFALTCLGVGMLIMVVMSMGAIYRGNVDDATSVILNTGADVWVVQRYTNGPFAESSRVPEDLKHTLRGLSGVVDAGALSFQNIQVDWKGRPLRLFAIGYDKDLGLGGPPNIVSGRPILNRHYEMVAGVKSGLKLGDALKLGLDDYKVVGLVRDVVSTSGDQVIYLNLPDAQKIQFKKDNDAIRNDRVRLKETLAAAGTNPDDRLVEGLSGETHIVNAVVLKVRKGYPADDVVREVNRWKHYRAMPAAGQLDIMTMGVIRKATMQLGLFRAILLAVSMAVIALIIYTQTMDKIRDIATLKLIGAPDRTIVRLIMEQSLLMGFTAYWIGLAVFMATYRYFPKRMIVYAIDLKMLFVAVMFICVLASLAGIRAALKVEPSRALGG
ncbi:MAG: ABC transporter permease [Nitrospirae bacterium]|nr:ABC transporter permease [Nitrospirota bacterium]MBI5696625.1 ABC transporter permease [Nitrospirota bacterium]